MKISFMTLGCPDWDLDTICSQGQEYGFEGVDFRGYKDHLDITQLPEFTTGVAGSLAKLHAAGLEVSAISSSIRVCEPSEYHKNLDEARRTIAVARSLKCKCVRVFGGGNLQERTHQELAFWGRKCMESILAMKGARDLHWLLETHDNWVRAEDCLLLLDKIPDPAFGVLWDMGNTWHKGGESPQEIITHLSARIGYTHIKDAVFDPNHPLAMEDGWYYVPPGTGQLPLTESISLLKSQGYAGWMVLEHEKRWHPNLPEPEEILPAFVEWIRPQIR